MPFGVEWTMYTVQLCCADSGMPIVIEEVEENRDE